MNDRNPIDFTDSKTPNVVALRTTGKPPPRYVVLRPAQNPEPLAVTVLDHEAMMAVVERQVKEGQLPVVYVYELVQAVKYVPSTEVIDASAVLASFQPPELSFPAP